MDPSLIRSLLKDIREVRQAKLRTGIKPTIGEEGTGLNGEYLQVWLPYFCVRRVLWLRVCLCLCLCLYQLTNLTPLEINELRPFFVRAMGVMTKLGRSEPEVVEEEEDVREDSDGDLSY